MGKFSSFSLMTCAASLKREEGRKGRREEERRRGREKR
jgi:hypothetical protein